MKHQNVINGHKTQTSERSNKRQVAFCKKKIASLKIVFYVIKRESRNSAFQNGIKLGRAMKPTNKYLVILYLIYIPSLLP